MPPRWGSPRAPGWYCARPRAREGRLKLVHLPARTLQVHWPEGNVLIPTGPTHREPGSKVPDYNAIVTLTPL
jgi:hypothetical protein